MSVTIGINKTVLKNKIIKKQKGSDNLYDMSCCVYDWTCDYVNGKILKNLNMPETFKMNSILKKIYEKHFNEMCDDDGRYIRFSFTEQNDILYIIIQYDFFDTKHIAIINMYQINNHEPINIFSCCFEPECYILGNVICAFRTTDTFVIHDPINKTKIICEYPLILFSGKIDEKTYYDATGITLTFYTIKNNNSMCEKNIDLSDY